MVLAVITLGFNSGARADEARNPLAGIISPPVIFFPPLAPIYGDRIADTTPTSRNPKLPAPPAELADFVSERFYPALGSRLHAGSVSSRMMERLDAFRATRGSLINELADQLAALNGVADETAGVDLRALAEKQSKRILTLEREAEELRRDLIDGNVLQRTVDWRRNRGWTLGVTRFRSAFLEADAHYQVVRAAAYYQDGLLIGQRDLLLEVAVELRNRARSAMPIPMPRIGDPSAMFFSPAMSRLRLPKIMPTELATKIGRYSKDKTDLKQELLELVISEDKASRSSRTAAFEALADRQWPQLVELEKLAEEIRVELAHVPREKLLAPPHLPPALMIRIQAYQQDRQVFLEEFQQTMDAASSMARWNPEQRMSIRAKVAESFHERTRDRYQAMRARYDAIQVDLALVASGQFDPETGRPLTAETLLRNYSAANEKFDFFGREEVIYRGYRTAMLLPGLSPEQRRLLFGAALVGLAQPLPWSEAAPSGLLPVPRSL